MLWRLFPVLVLSGCIHVDVDGHAFSESWQSQGRRLTVEISDWVVRERQGTRLVSLWGTKNPGAVFVAREEDLPEGFLEELERRLPPREPVLVDLWLRSDFSDARTAVREVRFHEGVSAQPEQEDGEAPNGGG